MTDNVLVFDFFGVICSEIAPYWLNRYFTETKSIEIKETIVHQADLGSISQEQLFQELSKLSHVSSAQIEADWMALVTLNHEVLDILRYYKKKHTIALLTNSPADFVRKIIQANNLAQLFDIILVSSEEKLAKPDVAFYNLMLSKLMVKPSNTVMIDDNPRNIDGAYSAGMNAIHFVSAEDLRYQLDRML